MIDDSPGGAASRAGLFASLKGLFGTSLTLLQNRLQLLGVELAEERLRLLSLVTYGAIALICLSAGLVFLAVFLTVSACGTATACWRWAFSARCSSAPASSA
jgi:uncharacterized membrane protein YqjE